MIYDIVISLFCTLISFIFGVLAHKTIDSWRQHGKTAIWEVLKNGNDLAIALTMREGPNSTSTPRATLAEVLALADILPTLQRLSINYSIINDNLNYKLSSPSNLLCIGGAKANAVTAKLLAHYGKTLPIKITSDPFSIIIGEKQYVTEYTDDKSQIAADYGVVLVVCEQGSTGKQKCRIAAFGGRGFGTRGAIQSLAAPDLVKRFKRYSKNNSFLAIIRVSGDSDEPTTSVEEFYPLDIYK